MNENKSLKDWILSANNPATKQLLFLLVVAFVFMWAAAILVQEFYGVAWFAALNAAGSTGLTLILAVLYFRQSKILESQQNLLSAELNRSVRQKHTETLRERVREWHGNIEFDDPDQDPWQRSGDNLPTVTSTSFKSAAGGTASEDGFTAIPTHLRYDRYFRDLLKNHAPELRRKATAIEQLQFEFKQEEAEFEQNFNYLVTKDCGRYTLEPEKYLAEWIFEELVKIKRRSEETFETRRERILAQISTTSEFPDGSVIWIQREIGRQTVAVYGAHYSSEQDLPPREQQDQLIEEVRELIDEMLDAIDSDRPFDEITTAHELLVSGNGAVTDLRHTLVEYDGRLVYPGDCEYLQEAEIRPSEDQ